MKTSACSCLAGAVGAVAIALVPAAAAAQAAPETAPSSAPAESSKDDAPKTPVARAPEPGSDWVELGLVTDDPDVSLFARETRRVVVGDEVVATWAFVCKAPCNQRVDPHQSYRVMGDKIVPSIDFQLAPGSGRVNLRVTPAQRRSRTFAQALATAGGVSLLAGLFFVSFEVGENQAANAIATGSASESAQLHSQANTYRDFAIGFFAAGAAIELVAILALQRGTTTLAPASTGSSAARVRPPPGLRLIPNGFAF